MGCFLTGATMFQLTRTSYQQAFEQRIRKSFAHAKIQCLPQFLFAYANPFASYSKTRQCFLKPHTLKKQYKKELALVSVYCQHQLGGRSVHSNVDDIALRLSKGRDWTRMMCHGLAEIRVHSADKSTLDVGLAFNRRVGAVVVRWNDVHSQFLATYKLPTPSAPAAPG